ncbi:MAG: histidine kinase, partial [Actinomycetes bacterium]
NARLHSQVQELAIIEDRERIARDLHDTVIQRLFAAGMSLQATSRMVDDAPAARILEAVDNLDRTIREIRGTVFALQHQQSTSLHAALRALLAESRSSLGFLPALLTEGPIDSIISPEIAEHILATTREAISNIAQHAKATSAEVFVLAGSDIRLRITDNGVGIAPPDEAANNDMRGNGLRNMSARAESLGGKLALRRGPEGGTVLEWSAALSE